jgi:hypothetical protein
LQKKTESWNIYGISDNRFLLIKTPDFLICAADKISKINIALLFFIRSKLPLRIDDPTVPERNRLHH